MNYNWAIDNGELLHIIRSFGNRSVYFVDRLHGYISRPPRVEANLSIRSLGSQVSPKTETSGHGRSSADRQFTFVNGRPCDLPKINRLVTDLWRRCSREAINLTSSGLRMPVQSACSRFPVFVLCFQIPTGKQRIESVNAILF